MWLEVALEVDRHRAAVEVVYRAATLEVDLQIICQLPFVGAKNRIPLPKDISKPPAQFCLVECKQREDWRRYRDQF